MSEDETEAGPRRSARSRKDVHRLGFEEGPSKRRKLHADEDEEEAEDDVEEADEDAVPVEDEDDFEEAPRKATGRNARGSQAASRRRAKKDGDGVRAKAMLKSDFNIAEDNTLFQAVRSTHAAIADTIGDWIQQYQSSDDGRDSAVAELINFVLRACGCNHSVDRHEASDLDGAADKLEEIQEAFQKNGPGSYPLNSKGKALKAFRASLAEFVEKLADESDQAEILYDGFFGEALQTWLVAATSSKLRSFRHTATVIALEFVSALCVIASARDDSLAKSSRALDKEKEKIGGQKARLKALSENVEAAHIKKRLLEGYFKDIFQAVFVNRYRDSDSTIRLECITALGYWMKKYPDRFLKGENLKYHGWLLTDRDKDTRLAALHALSTIYKRSENIGLMRHFTERFRARLVEMACAEVEMQVRIAAMDVLGYVAKHGLLTDPQIDELASLIFHIDVRVRNAIAQFFITLVEEDVAEHEGSLQQSHGRDHSTGNSRLEKKQRLDWLKLKCLCKALLRHGGELATDPAREVDSSGNEGRTDSRDASTLGRSRMSAAAEALFAANYEPLLEWQPMIEYLLLDHSAASGSQDIDVSPILRLNDKEEALLLELLAITAGLTHSASGKGTKGVNDAQDTSTQLSQAVIKVLPRLFAKYKADAYRICDVLILLTAMDHGLYLSLRITSEYEQLWDEIIDVFGIHADLAVLEQVMKAAGTMQATASLSNINNDKMTVLEEVAIQSLLNTIGNQDIATAGLGEEQLRQLRGNLSRLVAIVSKHDMISKLESVSEEGQASAIAIVAALADRGQLGYDEENEVVDSSLTILFYDLVWKSHNLVRHGRGATDQEVQNTLDVQRAVIRQLMDIVMNDRSTATVPVKRSAFAYLLDLHTLFGMMPVNGGTADAKGAIFSRLELTMTSETAFRIAGLMQGEFERYNEIYNDEAGSKVQEDGLTDVGSEIGNDAEESGEVEKTLLQKSTKNDPGVMDESRRNAQAAFRRLVSCFVRCIHAGVLDVRHASVVTAHYGRLDTFVDESARHLFQILRAQGPLGEQQEAVTTVLVETLCDAGTFVVNGVAPENVMFDIGKKFFDVIQARRGIKVYGKLPDADIARIHTEVNAFAVKTYAALVEDGASDGKRTRSLLIFKALQSLCGLVSGKDALKVQSTLDAELKSAGIKIGKGVMWEPYRLYHKALDNVMSKDDAIKGIARKRATDNAEGEDDDDDRRPKPKRPRQLRVKPKPRTPGDHSGDEDEDEYAETILPQKTTRRTRGLGVVSPAKSHHSPEIAEIADQDDQRSPDADQQEEEDEIPGDRPVTNGAMSHDDREGSIDTVASSSIQVRKRARV